MQISVNGTRVRISGLNLPAPPSKETRTFRALASSTACMQAFQYLPLMCRILADWMAVICDSDSAGSGADPGWNMIARAPSAAETRMLEMAVVLSAMDLDRLRPNPFALKVPQDKVSHPVIADAVYHGGPPAQTGYRNQRSRHRSAALDHRGQRLLNLPPCWEMLHQGEHIHGGCAQPDHVNLLCLTLVS